MYGVNGTPGDWNFFEKDFSNHIGAAEGAAPGEGDEGGRKERGAAAETGSMR